MTDDITPEMVMAAVSSGRGAELHRLLDNLRTLAEIGRAVELPPPGHEWLDNLDEVDDEMVATFLDLLHTYPRFTPSLTPEQIREESLEANLRHGSHRSGFHHALLTSISLLPDFETSELLLMLGTRGVLGEQETEAAKWLVSYLLDNATTRPATVRALGWMQGRDDLDPVVDYVRSQLEPAEIAELEEW